MPTDLSHMVAFGVTMLVIGLIGVGAFVYIWATTKPRKDQRSFDFGQRRTPSTPVETRYAAQGPRQ